MTEALEAELRRYTLMIVDTNEKRGLRPVLHEAKKQIAAEQLQPLLRKYLELRLAAVERQLKLINAEGMDGFEDACKSADSLARFAGERMASSMMMGASAVAALEREADAQRFREGNDDLFAIFDALDK